MARRMGAWRRLRFAAAAMLCGLLALLINIRDLLAESLAQRD